MRCFVTSRSRCSIIQTQWRRPSSSSVHLGGLRVSRAAIAAWAGAQRTSVFRVSNWSSLICWRDERVGFTRRGPRAPVSSKVFLAVFRYSTSRVSIPRRLSVIHLAASGVIAQAVQVLQDLPFEVALGKRPGAAGRLVKPSPAAVVDVRPPDGFTWRSGTSRLLQRSAPEHPA